MFVNRWMEALVTKLCRTIAGARNVSSLSLPTVPCSFILVFIEAQCALREMEVTVMGVPIIREDRHGYRSS